MEHETQAEFAIHAAAREGRTNAVEYLLNANSRLANQRDDDDRLPIHWAVSYNHLPVVELLVSRRDFDPDVKDGSGWTPLMIAASLRDGDDLVDLLLKKEADVNAKNYNGQTALHFAASKNNLGVARRLIFHKATARMKDKRSQLPLHRAAAVGSVPMVKLLLESNCPVNAADISGYTALHHGE
ncbi:Ankyrin-2 [Xylographa pallens]|nr:Ankyrin-2 [Xylographa pallens]